MTYDTDREEDIYEANIEMRALTSHDQASGTEEIFVYLEKISLLNTSGEDTEADILCSGDILIWTLAAPSNGKVKQSFTLPVKISSKGGIISDDTSVKAALKIKWRFPCRKP